MMRRLLQSLICTIVLLCLTGSVQAAGEFGATYDVQYAVAPSGVTIVTQHITLTNKFTNYYPHKYSIVVDSAKIGNVIAYDSKGIIRPNIIQKDGKTEIVLTFNEQVVGLGKVLSFSLRFENGEIAQKNGNIWEINIPGVANDQDLESYSVSLSVPPSFGTVAYMSPPPAEGRRWTKDQMIRGGISAAYGTKQAFDVTLSYYVENPNVTPARAEIALPPDTAYQKVTIGSIEPNPKTVQLDADGNWLAQYELLAGQRLEITAQAHIVIQLASKEGYTPDTANMEQYLKPTKFWDSNNEKIAALARIYKTPKDIYAYVVSTLSYDYKRVEQNPVRMGALAILDNPQNAICMEFTDLFIAIARAAGIPARELVGYAHTTNATLRPLSLVSDVLHAWPEYFDSQRNVWVPIDPTWGNTTGGIDYFSKLDFNHIVFAVRGTSSEYPYPAGFYRKTGKTGKDVGVAFSTAVDDEPQGKLSVSIEFPDTVTAGMTARGKVIATNQTGSLIDGASVTVDSTPVNVGIQKQLTSILPYATIEVPVSIALPYAFYEKTGSVMVSIDGEKTQSTFVIKPMYMLMVISGGLFGFSFILLGYIMLRAKLWKRHSPKK